MSEEKKIALGITTECLVDLPDRSEPMVIASGVTNRLDQVIPDLPASVITNIINADDLYEVDSVSIIVKLKPRAKTTWPFGKEE